MSKNLKYLYTLRNLNLAAQIIFFVVVPTMLSLTLPLLQLAIVLGLTTLVNIYTRFRLSSLKEIHEKELLFHILFDVCMLTALLYLTGGGNNPFSFLLLIPVTIAAVLLHHKHVWTIAGATLLCYTLLVYFHRPLEFASHAHNHADLMNLHVFGMWFGFFLSAGVVSFFVTQMALELRHREQQLAQAREKSLRDNNIIALGTLAATAAHELGTPLSSIAVISKELQNRHADDQELNEDLKLLSGEVARCKGVLSEMSASAGNIRAESSYARNLDEFVDETLTQWHSLHPEITLHKAYQQTAPHPQFIADDMLGRALQIILNNAIDADATKITVQIQQEASFLTLHFIDNGNGLLPEVEKKLGKTAISTKGQHGMGIGLLLANAIIERYDGSLSVKNNTDQGIEVTLELPLVSI